MWSWRWDSLLHGFRHSFQIVSEGSQLVLKTDVFQWNVSVVVGVMNIARLSRDGIARRQLQQLIINIHAAIA